MELMEIHGVRATATLSSGKKVSVTRNDSGEGWGLVFGTDEENVSFALTNEAMAALLKILRHHGAELPQVAMWNVLLREEPITDPDDKPPA